MKKETKTFGNNLGRAFASVGILLKNSTNEKFRGTSI